MTLPDISVVIPTYLREQVLIETIRKLLVLVHEPSEIVIVDQTPVHDANTNDELRKLEKRKKITWIRLSRPSITHAMNVGLEQAKAEVVLFLDDDIVPGEELVAAHAKAQVTENIVAGQVLQPGDQPSRSSNTNGFEFRSSRRQYVSEIMGGNFSIKRSIALALGGFDENFVHVAYRFEAEFAGRALARGERILFEPAASIQHLKEHRGGTRAFGQHLTTVRPSHSVGAYYYLFRTKAIRNRFLKMIARAGRSIRTKHHLLHPWWIPLTLLAEIFGFCWAAALAIRGPRLIQRND